MQLPNKNRPVDIKEMYALKVGALWRALCQENISLWILIFYFLFEYVRPQQLYPAIDVIPYAQILLLLSIVTAILDPTVKWQGNVVNRWMLVFTVVVILSGLLAFRPAASLLKWETFGGWFLIYFVVVNVVNTERRMMLFLLAFCLFSLKMAQHGVIGWATKGFSFTSHGIIGAPGWFRNSGEYSVQMIIYGSLAISMVVALKQYMGRYTTWVAIVIAATGYMAVMGASSRGSQIGLAAIGVWMLLQQKNGLKGLLLLVLAAGALYFILPEEQLDRFREIGDDETSQQRLLYWSYAITNIIPDFPILGLGYGNWMTYMYFVEPGGLGRSGIIEVQHNIFVEAATDLGLVGLFVYLMLILFSFINNRRTRKMARELDNRFIYFVSLGLDAGFIGFLVAGMFVTILFYPFCWIQMAIIVALNNLTRTMYEEKTGASRRPIRGRGVKR